MSSSFDSSMVAIKVHSMAHGEIDQSLTEMEEELEKMTRAIEGDCEGVDPHEW